jgi:hypothetical protein
MEVSASKKSRDRNRSTRARFGGLNQFFINIKPIEEEIDFQIIPQACTEAEPAGIISNKAKKVKQSKKR